MVKYFAYVKCEIKSTHREPRYHASEARISHCEAVFHPPVRVDLVEKDLVFRQGLFLSMGYKKDVFRSFAYDFELSRCAKAPIVTVISYH